MLLGVSEKVLSTSRPNIQLSKFVNSLGWLVWRNAQALSRSLEFLSMKNSCQRQEILSKYLITSSMHLITFSSQIYSILSSIQDLKRTNYFPNSRGYSSSQQCQNENYYLFQKCFLVQLSTCLFNVWFIPPAWPTLGLHGVYITFNLQKLKYSLGYFYYQMRPSIWQEFSWNTKYCNYLF